LNLECSDLLGAMTVLQTRPGILDVAVFGSGLHVKVADENRAEPEIRSALGAANIQVQALEPIPPSMEDVFVSLIEADEKASAK
jgi:drug efflux transport system ATP-binding protein